MRQLMCVRRQYRANLQALHVDVAVREKGRFLSLFFRYRHAACAFEKQVIGIFPDSFGFVAAYKGVVVGGDGAVRFARVGYIVASA